MLVYLCVCLLRKFCSCVRSSPPDHVSVRPPLFMCSFVPHFSCVLSFPPVHVPIYSCVHSSSCSCVRSSPLFVCPFNPPVHVTVLPPCSCVHSSPLCMCPFFPPFCVSIHPPCSLVHSSPCSFDHSSSMFVCPCSYLFISPFVPPVHVSVRPPCPFITTILVCPSYSCICSPPPLFICPFVPHTSFRVSVHPPPVHMSIHPPHHCLSQASKNVSVANMPPTKKKITKFFYSSASCSSEFLIARCGNAALRLKVEFQKGGGANQLFSLNLI